MKQSGEQVYNQIDKDESSSNNDNDNDNNNKKFEFTSTESNSNNNDKSDYVTFNTRINLQNIEKDGFLLLLIIEYLL